MRPSATHESGHSYFAQTGHSHFAATLVGNNSCVENRKSVRFANQTSNSEIPGRFSVEVRHEAWIVTSLALIVGIVMVGAPLLAHHGTGVAYVRDKEVTLKGTVTEWFWPIRIAAFYST